MAQYLVTGGAGFIGSHVVEALVARGRQVRVLDNLSSGKLDHLEAVRGRIDVRKGDVRDLGRCREAMDGIQVLIHLAAVHEVPGAVDERVVVHVEHTPLDDRLYDLCAQVLAAQVAEQVGGGLGAVLHAVSHPAQEDREQVQPRAGVVAERVPPVPDAHVLRAHAPSNRSVNLIHFPSRLRRALKPHSLRLRMLGALSCEVYVLMTFTPRR